MSDENLLDGSSFAYKLTKDMLASPDPPSHSQPHSHTQSYPNTHTHSPSQSQPHSHTQSTPYSHTNSPSHSPSHSHTHSHTHSPSHGTPRIPNFLNSPPPQVSFILRQKQYNINTTESGVSDTGYNPHSLTPSLTQSHTQSHTHTNSTSGIFSLNDLTPTIHEYKKEIENFENKKREELLSSQVSLLEIYKNKIANNNVIIEEIKQEYEQKIYQQKMELNEKYEEEIKRLKEEENTRMFADRARIGVIKEKLKLKYEHKIQDFQQDVEDTRTALYNKKLQVQGAVDHANREITSLRLQQESTNRIHQEEIKQKESHISELQSIINSYKTDKMKDEEMIRKGVEIAALVIHMHQKSRPLESGDLDVDELYKYLNVTAASDGKSKDSAAAQTIVPTAYLQKAMQSSSVSI